MPPCFFSVLFPFQPPSFLPTVHASPYFRDFPHLSQLSPSFFSSSTPSIPFPTLSQFSLSQHLSPSSFSTPPISLLNPSALPLFPLLFPLHPAALFLFRPLPIFPSPHLSPSSFSTPPISLLNPSNFPHPPFFLPLPLFFFFLIPASLHPPHILLSTPFFLPPRPPSFFLFLFHSPFPIPLSLSFSFLPPLPAIPTNHLTSIHARRKNAAPPIFYENFSQRY